MTDLLKTFPEIEEYIDDSEKYLLNSTEVVNGGNRFMIVTQRGRLDGQQLVFRWDGERFEYWDNDTLVDTSLALPAYPDLSISSKQFSGACGPSSTRDHEKVHRYVKSQAGKFSSRSGPDGGNLACVWVVRHLIRNALGRAITRTDGTAVLYPELRRCMGPTKKIDDVLPGGIIISPTQNIRGSKKRNVGHVGILGTGKGSKRIIYSNSSARARLEQNFTVGSWNNRYKRKKELSVYCYPIPLRGSDLTS